MFGTYNVCSIHPVFNLRCDDPFLCVCVRGRGVGAWEVVISLC